jgi:hypothetical protein
MLNVFKRLKMSEYKDSTSFLTSTASSISLNWLVNRLRLLSFFSVAIRVCNKEFFSRIVRAKNSVSRIQNYRQPFQSFTFFSFLDISASNASIALSSSENCYNLIRSNFLTILIQRLFAKFAKIFFRQISPFHEIFVCGSLLEFFSCLNLRNWREKLLLFDFLRSLFFLFNRRVLFRLRRFGL